MGCSILPYKLLDSSTAVADLTTARFMCAVSGIRSGVIEASLLQRLLLCMGKCTAP